MSKTASSNYTDLAPDAIEEENFVDVRFTKEEFETLKDSVKALKEFYHANNARTVQAFLHYFVTVSMAMAMYILKEEHNDLTMNNHIHMLGTMNRFLEKLETVNHLQIDALNERIKGVK